ncbi:MAG: NAD-dependent DNA ligase LigA [bacterium]
MVDIQKVQLWNMLSVDDLERAVRFHNHAYWVDNNAVISDVEFDRLVEALREKAPQSPVLDAIGPAGANEFESDGVKVEHNPPMLSLDKCYDEDTLVKWFGKFSGEVVVSPKVDGVAGCMRYDSRGNLVQAATRGNGVVGEDFTENARFIVDLPEKIASGPLEVRGECYIPLDVFRRKFEGEYSSPRNLTAGALKQKDPKKTATFEVHFFGYDVIGKDFESESAKMAFLKEAGFSEVENHLIHVDQLQSVYEDILARRAELNYDTDGVVYKVNDTAEQQRMGLTAHHPRYAIAYKFQGDAGQSILREVHWSVSRTGAINPVGIVDPVELSGATVTRASLHNLSIMEKLGGDAALTLGSRVMMVRRGGVIPHLEKVLEPGNEPVVIPTECPFCGAATYRQSDVLVADHNDNCRGSRLRQIEHFASVMEIKGFGPKLLEALYDEEIVTSPADFFTLTVQEMLELDRVGRKLAEKLVERIAERRSVRADIFLRALGIDELGNHVSKILIEHYPSLEAILAVTRDELAAIHTIGDVIADKVTAGLQARREDILELARMLDLRFPTEADRAPTDAALSGKKFLFTGALEAMSRKDAQKKVVALGGETPSGVVKDLDYLVIGDADLEKFRGGWRTSKLQKAEAYNAEGGNIQIIGETEFIALIEG